MNSSQLYSESQVYTELINYVKQYLELGEKSYQTIQDFKKLIKDHLDPSEKDIDLDNTPIHLDEIDHHLHPQIQEILTNNFGIRQQQYQIFGLINETIFKLSKEYPNISQLEMQTYFIEHKIPIYLIPVIPSMTNQFQNYDTNQEFIWGNTKQEYQLSIILTPNKKYLKETITKYGFDSLYEITNEYINKAGFINIS